jgi:hypothetical protein
MHAYIHTYIHTYQAEAVDHEELAVVVDENNRLRIELEAALAAASGEKDSSHHGHDDKENDLLRGELVRLQQELTVAVAKVCGMCRACMSVYVMDMYVCMCGSSLLLL